MARKEHNICLNSVIICLKFLCQAIPWRGARHEMPERASAKEADYRKMLPARRIYAYTAGG